MPFNLNCKRGSTLFEDEEHVFNVNIQLLDNSLFDCAIPLEALGKDCLERIAKSLELQETQYFGLSYVCKKNRQCWIELDKNLKKQLDRNALRGSKEEMLFFRVRFYIPSVLSLEQEITRYLYYLQLRTDVIDGKLLCREEMAVLLASFALQAEFGDYDEQDMNEDFISEYVLLPKNQAIYSKSDLNLKIQHLHKQHRGMSTQAAELAYIIEAQQLEGYGEEIYQTKDKDSNPIFIGASSIGLFVKHPQGLPTVYFKWPDVIHMGYHKKYFSVESVKIQDTVQFGMEDAESARYVWKMFVAQHKFFKHYKFDPSQTALRRLSQLAQTPILRRATLPKTPDSLRKLVQDDGNAVETDTGVSGFINTGFDMLEEQSTSFYHNMNPCKTTGLSTSSACTQDNSRENSSENLFIHGGNSQEFQNRCADLSDSSGILQEVETSRTDGGGSGRTISINSVDRHQTKHPHVERRISLDSHLAGTVHQVNLYRSSVEELHPKHGRLRTVSVDSNDSSSSGSFTQKNQFGLVKMSTFGNLAEMDELFDNNHKGFKPLPSLPDTPEPSELTEMFEITNPSEEMIEQSVVVDGPLLRNEHENQFRFDEINLNSLTDEALGGSLSSERGLKKFDKDVQKDNSIIGRESVVPENTTRGSVKDNCSDVTAGTSGYSTSDSENADTSPSISPAKSATQNTCTVSSEQSLTKSIEQSSHKSTEQSSHKSTEQSSHKSTEQLSQKSKEQPNIIASEKSRRVSPKDSQLEYLEQHLSQSSLYAEFEFIPVKKQDSVLTSASLPIHKEFNRYQEILPYEDTRVKLNTSHNAYRSDYINANHVIMSVGKSKYKYIASQAPLENTCSAFWQMIWEQKVAVVVMLSDQKESNNGKYFCYWPDEVEGSAVKFGEYKIAHLFCNKSDVYCVRGFTLKWNRSKETRRVIHLQFLVWPDNGVPQNPDEFLELLEEMDSFQRQTKHKGSGSPVVVHCTAGVGRTGVLILTHLMLACLKNGQPVDIPRTLGYLRTQRMHLVQTLRQYRFVYTALIQYLNGSRLI